MNKLFICWFVIHKNKNYIIPRTPKSTVPCLVQSLTERCFIDKVKLDLYITQELEYQEGTYNRTFHLTIEQV